MNQQGIISTHERLLEAKKLNLDYSVSVSTLYLEKLSGFLVKTTLTVYKGDIVRQYESSAFRAISDSIFTALETADTVSLGRALGKAGVGIEQSFITSDEISVTSLTEKATTKGTEKSINRIKKKI